MPLDRPAAIDRVPDPAVPATVTDRPDEGGRVGGVATALHGAPWPVPVMVQVEIQVGVRVVHVPYKVVPVGLTPVRSEGPAWPGREAVEPQKRRRVARLGVLDEATALGP